MATRERKDPKISHLKWSSLGVTRSLGVPVSTRLLTSKMHPVAALGLASLCLAPCAILDVISWPFIDVLRIMGKLIAEVKDYLAALRNAALQEQERYVQEVIPQLLKNAVFSFDNGIPRPSATARIRADYAKAEKVIYALKVYGYTVTNSIRDGPDVTLTVEW